MLPPSSAFSIEQWWIYHAEEKRIRKTIRYNFNVLIAYLMTGPDGVFGE